MEKKEVKALVTFRETVNGEVVAICGKHDAITVDANKVDEYIDKMLELTGGTEVEFNDTFRQICKDRVFYAFEPIDEFTPEHKPHTPMVVECVLLSNDSVAMNLNGKIEICSAEDGNTMWETKEDALEAAKQNALDMNSEYLDILFADRKLLKDELKRINSLIDEALAFKKSV